MQYSVNGSEVQYPVMSYPLLDPTRTGVYQQQIIRDPVTGRVRHKDHIYESPTFEEQFLNRIQQSYPPYYCQGARTQCSHNIGAIMGGGKRIPMGAESVKSVQAASDSIANGGGTSDGVGGVVGVGEQMDRSRFSLQSEDLENDDENYQLNCTQGPGSGY